MIKIKIKFKYNKSSNAINPAYHEHLTTRSNYVHFRFEQVLMVRRPITILYKTKIKFNFKENDSYAIQEGFTNSNY